LLFYYNLLTAKKLTATGIQSSTQFAVRRYLYVIVETVATLWGGNVHCTFARRCS